ncbi:hypothetical protein T492DRAFT_1022749 [Pavlovales sp. CCMP2436]|nr:hypothetical protein T492DRAFT_1022749 [Pavlovales sp. CCMP2436]
MLSRKYNINVHVIVMNSSAPSTRRAAGSAGAHRLSQRLRRARVPSSPLWEWAGARVGRAERAIAAEFFDGSLSAPARLRF